MTLYEFIAMNGINSVQFRNDLLPCPHCGNTNVAVYMKNDITRACDTMYPCTATVCCRDATAMFGCGASGGTRDTVEEAVSAWNRREQSC